MNKANRHISAALVLVSAICASIPASAATTVTPVAGSKGITDQGCLQQLTFAVGEGENCMYDGGPSMVPAAVPYGEVTGPYAQAAYYDDIATPAAFSTAWVKTPNDGKIAQLINGSVTIDDSGTPANGADDQVSFTLTLTSPGGGAIIRQLGTSVVDKYQSMTQVLAPRGVTTATANGSGGFDYVIGVEGFPTLRTFALAGPCLGQDFGSLDCEFSFTAPGLDPDGWTPISLAGLSSLEGNTGTRTTGTLDSPQCTDTGANNDCQDSKVSFAPLAIGPNATPGGGVTAEDVGWDQLVLKISTDASGNVLAMQGFDVQEYQVFGPSAACGSDPGAMINCNSWIAGYFTVAALPGAGIVAVDDGPFGVAEGGQVDIDVLANDSGYTNPVTVTVTTPAALGTTQVIGSPGDASGVSIQYTANPGANGPDSFVYTVADGSSSASATVALIVGNQLPVASDGEITSISTKGVSPLGGAGGPLTGTFQAPGNGGSLGDPGPNASIAVTQQGTRGTATVAGTLLTYTVTDPGFFSGTDSFTYLITDNDGETDSGVVTVTIADVPPTIDETFFVSNEDRPTPPITLTIAPGNGATDQHTLLVTTQATNGICVVSPENANGKVVYTPEQDFVGTDSCVLTLTDGDGDSDTGTLSITVNPVHEVPGTIGGASSLDLWSLLTLGLMPALRRGSRRRLLGAGLALLAGVQGVLAQEPSASEEPESLEGSYAIEEIVVTSRKVAENIQEVPLSITAFGSNAIQQYGIRNLNDVAALTPGLNFFNAFGENLPVPVIRGIVPTDIFGQNNAAIFVDGVYISGREGLNFSQLDIERIEVVKGPQSALYGRDAFSGAINYVTKAPSDHLETELKAEAGNFGKIRGSAMVTGPLWGDTLTGRVSALYDEWDGSYSNALVPGNDIGGYRYRSWQAALQWRPADTVDVRLSYYGSNDDIDDPAAVALPANCEDRIDDTTGVRLLNFCGEVPDIKSIPGLNGSSAIPKVAEATGENRQLDRGILSVVWDVGTYGTFTSLTGYVQTQQDSVSDFSRSLGYNQPFLYCDPATVDDPGVPNSCGTSPANLRFFTGIYNEELGTNVDEFSQEFRFSSPQDQRLRFLVGAVYYNTDETSYPGTAIATGPLPTSQTGQGIGLAPFDPTEAPNFAIGTAIFHTTFTPDGGLDPLGRPVSEDNTEGWAVFGGMDYDFTEKLTGRVELRGSWERKQVDTLAYAPCNATEAECGDDQWDLRVLRPMYTWTDGTCVAPDGTILTIGECSASGSARFDQVTGRLGLKYQATDDWMVYGSIANGEKPGGLQLVSVTVVPPVGPTRDTIIPNTFDPEKIVAYELGVKGEAFDGRLVIDTAIFFNDWTDIVLRQLTEIDPESGLPLDTPTAINVNAADADVLGIEFTADAALTENLTSRFTLGWQDSELNNAQQDTYITFPSFAPDGDVSGNQLLRQPEWMSSLSFNYQRELVNDWIWYAGADGSYQSGIYVGNDNQSWLPEHTYVNGKLGISSDNWDLNVWVRNLFEDDGAIAAFRDIYFTNTDNNYPPFLDQGPRPNFDQFVPFRLTVTYPTLRTYGMSVAYRFSAGD